MLSVVLLVIGFFVTKKVNMCIKIHSIEQQMSKAFAHGVLLTGAPRKNVRFDIRGRIKA
jgi:hypothetical protein